MSAIRIAAIASLALLAALVLPLAAIAAPRHHVVTTYRTATPRRHMVTTYRTATPPASFLKYRVDSVAQLLAQIRADRTVRLRYAHLFGISENKVVAYMSKNLVESYIPATGAYKVWCVRPNGRVFVVKQHFHAGIRVFALRNGEPVLKWACGNPLTSRLPAPPQSPAMESMVVRHPVMQVMASTIEVTPSEGAQEMVEAVSEETATEIMQTPEHVPLVPFELVKGSAEEIVYSSSASRIPFLPFVPLVGLIPRTGGNTPFGSITRSGGASPQGNTGTGSRSGSGGGLVPETSPAVTLALGLLPLGGMLLLSRRRRDRGVRAVDR